MVEALAAAMEKAHKSSAGASADAAAFRDVRLDCLRAHAAIGALDTLTVEFMGVDMQVREPIEGTTAKADAEWLQVDEDTRRVVMRMSAVTPGGCDLKARAIADREHSMYGGSANQFDSHGLVVSVTAPEVSVFVLGETVRESVSIAEVPPVSVLDLADKSPPLSDAARRTLSPGLQAHLRATSELCRAAGVPATFRHAWVRAFTSSDVVDAHENLMHLVLLDTTVGDGAVRKKKKAKASKRPREDGDTEDDATLRGTEPTADTIVPTNALRVVGMELDISERVLERCVDEMLAMSPCIDVGASASASGGGGGAMVRFPPLGRELPPPSTAATAAAAGAAADVDT